ncbi:MAG TPA: DNA-processing protein DprA [Chitinophagaceae bacterium]|nr:DNA-processing protein DprA [Chitinophagaceae bacterium]
MANNLLHQIALTLIPSIGPVHTKALIDHFGDAKTVFTAKRKELIAIEGITDVKINAIKDFDNFAEAEAEITFIEKYKIQPLFITDKDYPQRLLHCYDAPPLLYYRGNANLNASKIISIIGTRSYTEYGKQVTDTLVEELKAYNVLIVSGLAYGIDAIAHKAALHNSLPTVGVLAHGLDRIYPAHHKSMAKEMLQNGGLLTEFRKEMKADKHNFPRRNRIVAGMADATIVIETALKGGSMITAALANGYNRDVFAIPGRINEEKSEGCNYLIKNNRAILLTDTQQLAENLGWERRKQKQKVQKELFIELNKEEQVIVDILKEKDLVHIDELYLKSGLSSSTVAAAILTLELQSVIASLPGKMYKML